jgi:hypothetical protein
MLDMGAACIFLDVYFKCSGEKTRIDPDKIYEINSFKWLNFGKGLIKGFGYFFNFLETLYTSGRNTMET